MTHDLDDLNPFAAPTPRPRADEETWADARADYENGVSTPVVAERYGLGERQVRRRAFNEGWKKPRRSFPRSFAGIPPGEVEELARDPNLQPFVDAHSYEVGELLMLPTADRLSRFGFRRAAEAAGAGRIAEAQAWMRLVAQVNRLQPKLDRQQRPFNEADYIRAEFAAQLREAFEAKLAPEEDEAEEDAAAADMADVADGR